MAVYYGAQMTKIRNTTPPTQAEAADVGGRVRCFNETVTLATQTTSDTIEIGILPEGARFLYGIYNSTVSLGGTATIAIGISGSTAKYLAATAYTATNTPTLFGKTAAVGVKLTAQEIVFITIAAASLPASGTVNIQLFYTVD